MSNPSTPSPTAPAPSDRGSTHGRSRPVPLIIGVLLALFGLPLLLGGLGLGWALATQRDDAGFFNAPSERVTSPTFAVASSEMDLGEIRPDGWWAGRDLAAVRLRVTADDGGPVFVGIGPSDEVAAYLDAAPYDEISDVTDDPFAYTLTQRGGDGSLSGPPADQTFWSVQAGGPGSQGVTYDLQPGTYTAVVMNADGSDGVTVDLAVGGRLGMLTTPLAWTMGVVGLLLIVGGGVLVAYGARPARDSEATATSVTASPLAGAGGNMVSSVTLTGHQDARLSRWLWLVKWFLAIPHFLVLVVLWLVFAVLTVVGFFAILFTGRYPRALFNLNVGILRWTWRVQFYATNAIGTDRYPPFTLNHADYPADLDITYPDRLSRGLVLIKSWLLAIPHLIVLGILAGTWRFGDADGAQFTVGGLIGALTLAAGLLLLFTGTYPRGLFDFLVGLNRWAYRAIAYVALMTDTYPPFRLDQGPTEPGRRPGPDEPDGPASPGMVRAEPGTDRSEHRLEV